MLKPYLERFNASLKGFQIKYPRQNWTDAFRDSLINDFTSFSSRIEDSSVDYGDTIRFFNDEFVNKEKLTSFLQLNEHRNVLANLLDLYQNFELMREPSKTPSIRRIFIS